MLDVLDLGSDSDPLLELPSCIGVWGGCKMP